MITNDFTQNSINTHQNAHLAYGQNSDSKKANEEESLEETLNRSAVNVSISMNAQIVLMGLQSLDLSKGNASAQNGLTNIFNNSEVFNFLSGQENESFLSLKDLGYEGKAITELSKEEATQLVSQEGFFGVEQTSARVSDFVIGISGDNLEVLKESRKGIVQGFEEAKKLWNDELPEISYRTQESTLALIDARIQKLESSSNT